MPIFTRSIFSLTTALLIGLANSACAGGMEHTGKHAAAAPVPKNYTALVAKKSGSGVELAYQIDGTPEVGKPLLIRMQVSSPAQAEVTVRAGEGLQLQGAAAALQSAAGQTAQHQFSVVPLAQGLLYVHLLSTASGRTSASAIAVQVGKQQSLAKTAGEVKTMPDGERVISVPAQQK